METDSQSGQTTNNNKNINYKKYKLAMCILLNFRIFNMSDNKLL